MPDAFDLVVQERRLLREPTFWTGIRNRTKHSEFANIELRIWEQYNKSINNASSIVEVCGFPNRISPTEILLRPSTAVLTQGHVFETKDPKMMPADYDFVRITARRLSSKPTQMTDSWNKFEIGSIESIILPLEETQLETSLSEVGNMMFEGYREVSPELKVSLVLATASSPKAYQRRGGLTEAILPSTISNIGLPEEILDDITYSIPREIRDAKSFNLQIPGLAHLSFPAFSWKMLKRDASEMNERWQKSVLSKKGEGVGLNEISIGISSESSVPKSIDDAWLRESDLPLMINPNLERKSSPQLEAEKFARFLITAHLNQPILRKKVKDSLTKVVNDELAKLGRKYAGLGYNLLIDLDELFGSPRDIEQLAKSLARCDGKSEVRETHYREALQLFIDVRIQTFDNFSIRGFNEKNKTIPHRLKEVSNTSRLIYGFLLKNTKSTSDEIKFHFARITDSNLSDCLWRLEAKFLIYRSTRGDGTIEWSAVEEQ